MKNKLEITSKAQLQQKLIEHFGSDNLSKVAQRVSDVMLKETHKQSHGLGIMAWEMETRKGNKDVHIFYQYEILNSNLIDISIHDVIFEDLGGMSNYLLDLISLIKQDAEIHDGKIISKQKK